MNEHLQQDREAEFFAGINPLFGRGNALLMRAVEAACAPAAYDPQAPVAPQPPASMRAAPIAAPLLSSPAYPAPLAPMSRDDRGVDEAWRLPSFASPPATQSLAASPAPLARVSDYDRGAAGRDACGLDGPASVAAAPRSSPAHSRRDLAARPITRRARREPASCSVKRPARRDLRPRIPRRRRPTRSPRPRNSPITRRARRKPASCLVKRPDRPSP